MKPVQVTVNMVFAPEHFAELWCEMNSEEQARFFNEIARITFNWERPFSLQVAAIVRDKALTMEGRSVMQDFGDYGYDLGVD